MIKLIGRAVIAVDDVAMEQVYINHHLTSKTDQAIQAAYDDPDFASLKRLCEKANSPLTVKVVRPAERGFWKVIFTIGRQKDDDNHNRKKGAGARYLL